MKAFHFSTVLLVMALGSAHAATSQPTTTLGLSQSIGLQKVALVIDSSSAEATPGRNAMPLASTATTTEPDAANGFDLETSLVLTLTGVLALLLVSRRRANR